MSFGGFKFLSRLGYGGRLARKSDHFPETVHSEQAIGLVCVVVRRGDLSSKVSPVQTGFNFKVALFLLIVSKHAFAREQIQFERILALTVGLPLFKANLGAAAFERTLEQHLLGQSGHSEVFKERFGSQHSKRLLVSRVHKRRVMLCKAGTLKTSFLTHPFVSETNADWLKMKEKEISNSKDELTFWRCGCRLSWTKRKTCVQLA